jgi:hypothetical protein
MQCVYEKHTIGSEVVQLGHTKSKQVKQILKKLSLCFHIFNVGKS